MGAQIFLLRLRSELHHAPDAILVERGENAAVDPKVGMPHVGAFSDVLQTQRQVAK
jgi:hypothetical protein